MIRTTVFLAVLLAAGLALPRSQAQGTPFQDGKGNDLKPDKVLAKPGTNQPWDVWVTHDKYAPLRAPRKDADEVAGLQLKFMDMFSVAARFPADDKKEPEYLFLVRVDADGWRVNKLIGWVKTDFVLQNTDALRTKDTIYRKAMIVNSKYTLEKYKDQVLFDLAADLAEALNDKKLPAALSRAFADKNRKLSPKATVEVLAKGTNWTVSDKPKRYSIQKDGDRLKVADSLTVAAAYGAPRHDAVGLANFQLCNIFFIYAEVNDYFLLGVSQSLGDPLRGDDPRKVVQGWVSKDRVTEWNTREAIEWDHPSTLGGPNRKRKEAGQIWSLAEDAYDWINRKGDPKAVFRETIADDKTGASRAFEADDMRFPILDWQGTDEFPLQHKSGNKLLNIGAMGKFVSLDGRGDVPEEKVTEFKKSLEAAQEQLLKLDIVFVIDDTQSMKPYLQATGEAVEAIVREARSYYKKHKAAVRIAVSYYNDFAPNAEHWPTTVMELKDVSDAKAMEQLIKDAKEHTIQDGGDELEQVFLGIKNAIDGSGFHPEATKMVILIGDAGDGCALNDKDQAAKTNQIRDWLAKSPTLLKRFNKEPREEGAKLKEILKRLQPAADQPWQFYAIHMEQKQSGQQRNEAAAIFEKQMKTLCKLVNDKAPLGDERAAYLHCVGTEVKPIIDQMKSAIGKRFAKLNEDIGKLNDIINALRRGEWHTEVTPEEADRLKKAGVENLHDFLNREGVQLYQKGYVWQSSRDDVSVPQVRTMVLLSEDEVESIVKVLRVLVREKNPKETLTDLLVVELKRIVGERDYKEGQDIKEIFKKVHGLEFRTPVLNRALKDLKEVSYDEKMDLDLKLRKLEDLRDGYRKNWIKGKIKLNNGKEVDGWVVQSEVVKTRYFTIPGSVSRWYWVDLLEELP